MLTVKKSGFRKKRNKRKKKSRFERIVRTVCSRLGLPVPERYRKRKKTKKKSHLKPIVRTVCFRLGLPVPDRYLTKDEAFVRSASKHLTRDDIVLDLGAHVGMAAVQFSHFAGRVYAFEPHPEIFEQLTMAARRYRRIVPINAAAALSDGFAELYSDRDPRPEKYTEGSTLAEGKSNLSYERSFQVRTMDLARFIRSLDKPVRMIKMDVEGYEYRLINSLIDAAVMDQIIAIHVEDHCDRVQGLSEERDKTLARIEAEGIGHKFDFDWP